MAYARKRRVLIELRDAYQRVIDEARPTYDQAAQLKRRVQAVQMQLDRYPLID